VGPSVKEGWNYASWGMLNCVVKYVHFLRKMVEQENMSAGTEVIHTGASEAVGWAWKGAP